MQRAPGGSAFDVLARGLRVHADHDVDFFLARDPAVFVRADGEPGGEAGDVGREHVLPADRHAHLEDGAHQDVVRDCDPEPLTVAT